MIISHWPIFLSACLLFATAAQAQKPAPVEDLAGREGAMLLQGQQRAGIA
ncbi:MAG: hypothetical protein ACK4N4_02960 [Burkholderiales bacterium]